MTRWKYLAPRLALIAVVPLAVWLLANPILRYWVTHQCQSITGSKVEVGSVHASLLSGTMQITDLSIPDPRDPNRNLIQADTALVTLNPAWFWRREFVVDHGVVRNLQFDAPRSSSGELDKRDPKSRPHIQWNSREFAVGQAKLQQQFIERLQLPEFAPDDPPFKLLRVSEELRSRWPSAGYDQKRLAESLQHRLATLASQLEEPSNNPLRDAKRIPMLVEQLQSVERELAQAKEDLSLLCGQLAADRLSLVEAKEADARAIGQRTPKRFGESKTLSKILVGKAQLDRIEDVLGWIRWFRSAALDHDKDFRPVAGRGVDVQFLSESQPTFWIRSLEMNGRGHFGDKTFQLVGSLRNLALQPRLLPDPCVVELRAPGEALTIRGELDRRAQEEIDHITLECSDLEIPGHSLGSEQAVFIDVGPSRMAARADVHIHGNTIDGRITIRQSNATLQTRTPELPLVSPKLTASLDRELQSIGDFSTDIRLAGRLECIQIEIASDLGSKLGPVVAQVAEARAEAAAQEHLSQLEKLYHSELALLNQVSQRRLDELAELLESGATRVAELDRLIPSSNGLNRMR